MKNILKSKIAVFLIVLVVVGAAIIIPQVIPQSGKEKTADNTDTDAPCDAQKTPYYCELRSEIIKLGTLPWDKASYYRNKNLISDYEKQSHKIKADEAAKLNELLNAKYLGVLATAIKAHCSSAASYNGGVIGDFENELRNVQVGSAMLATKNTLSSLLMNFKVAVSITGSIDNYISSQPYNSANNQKYFTQMSNFEKMEVIGRNQALISGFRKCRTCLSGMETLEQTLTVCKAGNRLSDKTDADIRKMSSVNGKLNSYYYAELKSLKSHE